MEELHFKSYILPVQSEANVTIPHTNNVSKHSCTHKTHNPCSAFGASKQPHFIDPKGFHIHVYLPVGQRSPFMHNLFFFLNSISQGEFKLTMHRQSEVYMWRLIQKKKNQMLPFLSGGLSIRSHLSVLKSCPF